VQSGAQSNEDEEGGVHAHGAGMGAGAAETGAGPRAGVGTGAIALVGENPTGDPFANTVQQVSSNAV